MQSAAATITDLSDPAAALIKADDDMPAFRAGDLGTLYINGPLIVEHGDERAAFVDGASVKMPDRLVPGLDYEIALNPDGSLSAHGYGAAAEFSRPVVGGFHYAPGGNAQERSGGDATPAINPHSIYDLNFRPACADPRGMTLVAGSFWADIYLLGTGNGCASECGATIADGDSLDRLDYATAVSLLAAQGKQVMSIFEFIEAAYGVTEKAARGGDPDRTGIVDADQDPKFTSKWGLIQATGCLWVWGHDGDPDEPRASIFGGSWIYGSNAGSRFAYLGYSWPESSDGSIGARGRCDHLKHAS